MKVSVKGLVLEKYTREVTNQNGAKEEKLYIRIFQSGERLNLDINVKFDTYSKVTEGQTIKLDDLKISSYKDVLYAREQ